MSPLGIDEGLDAGLVWLSDETVYTGVCRDETNRSRTELLESVGLSPNIDRIPDI